MRIALLTIMLAAACGGSTRTDVEAKRGAVVAQVKRLGCEAGGPVWDAYDALTLAILSNQGVARAVDVRAMLDGVPRSQIWGERVIVEVEGGGEALVTVVGLQCLATNAGGRVSLFTRAAGRWVQAGRFEIARDEFPQLEWSDPAGAKIIVSERWSGTSSDGANVRALRMEGGKLVVQAATEGVRALESQRLPDGVALTYQSPSDEHVHQERWDYGGDTPKIARTTIVDAPEE